MKRLVLLLGLTAGPGVLVPGVRIFPEPLLAQSAAEAQRDLSREDGAALHRWAQRYLLEVGGRHEDAGQVDLREMEKLRAMYFMSVADRDWVRDTDSLLTRLEASLASDSSERVALGAYRGALEVVRAKHARWPPNKLDHLRDGLAILDGTVARAPENLEVRYLRLVSSFYLPFFLKRDESVEEDFKLLVSALPRHSEAFSPAMYTGVVRFVLDNGNATPEERSRLEEALGDATRAVR